jgi:hypothetical protein
VQGKERKGVKPFAPVEGKMYHTKDTRQLELENFVLPSPRTTERDRKEATDV